MVKDFNNKTYGIGEKHITYSLGYRNHIISPQFDTKQELKRWIKENMDLLKTIRLKHPHYNLHNFKPTNILLTQYHFEIIQTIEIYASKVIDILDIEDGE